MITPRLSQERGQADFGWLYSQHTFSFGQYYDPKYMGFGPLRVINEDQLRAGKGFNTHSHDNMEIVSYVLSGALAHKDSMGNSSSIKPFEIQRMSAGTGITHSEFNHSNDNDVHFLQIWFLPQEKDIVPSYEQKSFAPINNKLNLVMSHKGRDNTVSLNQDVDMYVGLFDVNENATYSPEPSRKQWIQVIEGALSVNDEQLSQGDGAAIFGEDLLSLQAKSQAHFVLFDMVA